MKMRRYFVMAAIAAASMSCGCCSTCTNNQTEAASANANPAAETYTGNDLSRAGKRDAGEALRSADPSVTNDYRQMTIAQTNERNRQWTI
jgi:hypothetical protein